MTVTRSKTYRTKRNTNQPMENRAHKVKQASKTANKKVTSANQGRANEWKQN